MYDFTRKLDKSTYFDHFLGLGLVMSIDRCDKQMVKPSAPDKCMGKGECVCKCTGADRCVDMFMKQIHVCNHNNKNENIYM